MRKVDDREEKKEKKKEKKKKRMAFLVATTSLPAVYRPNGYARKTITGTPHARANFWPMFVWTFFENGGLKYVMLRLLFCLGFSLCSFLGVYFNS